MRLKNRFLTLLLSLMLTAAGTFPVGAGAQTDQTASGDLALAAKADKLLKHVYHASREAAGVGPAGRRATAQVVNELSDVAGVSLGPGGGVSVSLIVQLSDGDAGELKGAGFAVGSVVGDIATVETEAGRLPELASLASVKRMWASTYRHPVNDRARQTAGIDNAQGQRVVSQTGRGVVVGVIDSGIDFRHPDFTVPGSNGTRTRIKFLLEMTAVGGDTSAWNYTLPGGTSAIGRLYTEADINAALAAPKPADQSTDTVKERDKNGHGTHVAGTAAGNGLGAPSAPGVYAGMAPEADLIIVKASRKDDGTASFSTSDTINAMQFIQTKAAELGEPFVINMSLGGQAGPHDGSDPDERAIDNVVNSGPGRAVCVAAGNEGSDSVHAAATVPAGGSVTLNFNANKPDFIDLYSSPRGTSGSGRYTVTVTEPDGTTLGPLAFSATGFNQQNGQLSDSSVRLWDALDNKGTSDPSDDQADVFLLFKDGAKNGTWTITLTNGSGEPDSTFDAWASGGANSDGSNPTAFTNFVDNNSHLVGSPGTSRGAITVGAYVARSASQTIGNFAFFTSPGPTADGRQKPEISADGYYLYSSRSSDTSDPSIFTYGTGSNALAAGVDQNLYGGLLGTSMATPVVTGSVALLLQANPGLSAGAVKTLIENSATRDSFVLAAGVDAGGWNSRFGFGKLNVAAALGVPSPTPTPTPTPTPSPTPTPTPAVVTLTGRVVENGQGLQGVLVGVSQTGGVTVQQQMTTGPDGTFAFNVAPSLQNYFILLVKSGYTFNPSFLVLTTAQPNGGDVVAVKGNPIDATDFFVTQHYSDFLGRAPDSSGLQFWTGGIESCGFDPQCRAVKRIDTSAAFFLSIEFQETGFLVYRAYQAAYGDATGTSTFGGAHTLPVPAVRRPDFMADTPVISQGVQVGVGDWQTRLEANKQAYMLAFVQTARFAAAYPSAMNAADFVNKLNANAGGVLSDADKTQLETSAFGGPNASSASASARAAALRAVAENAAFDAREKNRAFVLMQYFGYLRRDPDRGPDTDYTGYDFWLQKLNQFGGNYVNAEMVKAFITSIEYTNRFGT